VTIPEFEAANRSDELGPLLDAVTDNAITNGKFAYYVGQAVEAAKINAVHRVYVRVDEKGTQAAAVTLINAVAVSARIGKPRKPPVLIVVRVERPFFFFIRTTISGVVLLVARVTQPVWTASGNAAAGKPWSHQLGESRSSSQRENS